MKRFVLIAGLAFVLACVGDLQSQPQPQPQPGQGLRTLKLTGTLGIRYVATVNGCRVVDTQNAVPFADGSLLEVGDFIVSVGGVSTRGTAINLEDKIKLAYASGNTEILVRDRNPPHDINAFNLP